MWKEKGVVLDAMVGCNAANIKKKKRSLTFSKGVLVEFLPLGTN